MSDMVERAAVAIAKCENIDTKRIALASYTKHASAALLAALDPEDEALVEAVALVIQYSGLSKDTGESIRGARFDECAEIARAAIKALRSSTAQGE